MIIALPSTAKGGKISRIIPTFGEKRVDTIPRNDVHYVVMEYGIAELRGKTLTQRALAIISIADPAFTDELNYRINQGF